MDSKLEQAKEWVDAEKVREEADRMDKGAENSMKPGHNEFSRGYAEAMQECAEHLRNLLTPSLPTLADMTPEERQACQWMQADVKLANGGSVTCVIADPRTPGIKVRVWAPHGGSDDVQEGRVTPLPGLPKLEWPGDGVEDAPTEDGNPTLPRPEDVPSGEAWLIAYEGGFHTALKADDGADGEPWIVSFTPGGAFLWLSDRDVTPISRLVPERKENA